LCKDVLVNSNSISNEIGWGPSEGLREQLRREIETC